MVSPIRQQLWEIATGLTAGGGLGLCFLLMRPLFGGRHRIRGFVFELLYLAIAFAWVFLAGQLGGRGTPPLYLLLCAAGWLLTHWLLGAAAGKGAEQTTAKDRGKVSNTPETPVLQDKKQKKHRKIFEKRAMQIRKNHI